MMVGNAGGAIMFALFLVGSGMIGLCVFAYLAHCVLVVLESTAAGADQVSWPDELYLTWMGEALTLGFLSLISLVPLALAASPWLANWLTDQPVLSALLLACLGLWLFFPVAILSCLSAESRWIVFRPVIVRRIVRLLPWTLAFYGASGVVLLVAVVPIRWSLSANVMTLFLTVPLTSAMILIYPRLLGILAFKIGKLGPLESSGWTWPGKRRARTTRAAQDLKRKASSLAHNAPARSPSGARIENSAHDADLAYAMADPTQPAFYDRPATASVEPRYEDDETREGEIPYGLATEHAPNPTIAQDYLNPKRVEFGPPTRRAKHAGAAHLVGVLGFPWYRTTLPIWLRLSMGGLLWCWLVVAAMHFMPF